MAAQATFALTSAEMLELRYLRQQEYLRKHGLQNLPTAHQAATLGQTFFLNQLPDHTGSTHSSFTNMYDNQQAPPTFTFSGPLSANAHPNYTSALRPHLYPTTVKMPQLQPENSYSQLSRYSRGVYMPLQSLSTPEDRFQITSQTLIPGLYPYREDIKTPKLPHTRPSIPSSMPAPRQAIIATRGNGQQHLLSGAAPAFTVSSSPFFDPQPMVSEQSQFPDHTLSHPRSNSHQPLLNAHEQRSISIEDTSQKPTSVILRCSNCGIRYGSAISWQKGVTHPEKTLCENCSLYKHIYRKNTPINLSSNSGRPLPCSSPDGSIFNRPRMHSPSSIESQMQETASSPNVAPLIYPSHAKSLACGPSSHVSLTGPERIFPSDSKSAITSLPFGHTRLTYKSENPSSQPNETGRSAPALNHKLPSAKPESTSRLSSLRTPALKPPASLTLVGEAWEGTDAVPFSDITFSARALPGQENPPHKCEQKDSTTPQSSALPIDVERKTSACTKVQGRSTAEATTNAQTRQASTLSKRPKMKIVKTDVKVKAESPSSDMPLAPEKNKDKKEITATKLTPFQIQELQQIWAADHRTPTLGSRKAWAAARGIADKYVHNWFYRKRANAVKSGIEVSKGTYELPISAPWREDLAVKKECELEAAPAGALQLTASSIPRIPVKIEENSSEHVSICPPALCTRSKSNSATETHASNTQSKPLVILNFDATTLKLSKAAASSSRKRKTSLTQTLAAESSLSASSRKRRKMSVSKPVSKRNEPEPPDVKNPDSERLSDWLPLKGPGRRDNSAILIKKQRKIDPKLSDGSSSSSSSACAPENLRSTPRTMPAATADLDKPLTHVMKKKLQRTHETTPEAAVEPYKTEESTSKLAGAKSSASVAVVQQKLQGHASHPADLHQKVPVSEVVVEPARYRAADINFVLPSEHWAQLSSIPLLLRWETAALVECLSKPAKSDAKWRASLSEWMLQHERLISEDKNQGTDLCGGTEDIEFSPEELEVIMQLNQELKDGS